MPSRKVPTKRQAEEGVQARSRPLLRRVATLVRRADQLVWDSLNAQPRIARGDHALRSRSILLARISTDLAASLLLAQRGYLMQSWAAGAALFEHSASLGYIGTNQERGAKWYQHSNWRYTPWKTLPALKETLTSLGLESHYDGYAEAYARLSAAKHANPVLQRRFGVQVTDAATMIRMDPFFTVGITRLARIGLTSSLRATTIALWSFGRDYVQDEQFPQRLGDLARDVAHENAILRQRAAPQAAT